MHQATRCSSLVTLCRGACTRVRAAQTPTRLFTTGDHHPTHISLYSALCCHPSSCILSALLPQSSNPSSALICLPRADHSPPSFRTSNSLAVCGQSDAFRRRAPSSFRIQRSMMSWKKGTLPCTKTMKDPTSYPAR